MTESDALGKDYCWRAPDHFIIDRAGLNDPMSPQEIQDEIDAYRTGHWTAKISDGHVDTSGTGFWAVHQGEVLESESRLNPSSSAKIASFANPTTK